MIDQKSEEAAEEGKGRWSIGWRRHVESLLPQRTKLLLSSPSNYFFFFFFFFSTRFFFCLLRFLLDQISSKDTWTFLVVLLVDALIFRYPTQWCLQNARILWGLWLVLGPFRVWTHYKAHCIIAPLLSFPFLVGEETWTIMQTFEFCVL